MAKLKRTSKSRVNDSCKNMTDLIFNYVTDKLGPSLKDEFERHLKICPDCVNFLNTYRMTVTRTKSLQPAAVPVKVRKNVLAFLRRKLHRIAALFLYLSSQLTG
jgi:Putative zinc-finger